MHQLKVLIFGPEPFLSTLNELKPFLKFNYFTDSSDINHDIILFHYDVLKDKKKKDFILKSLSLKICASKEKKWSVKCDGSLLLPTTIYELNTLIENISAKQKFSKNSDIKVKSYSLDKNEKKLSKKNVSVILTEKEIQLIELLIDNNKPISKENILSLVWNYSEDADTHTVETHIYRLRKKINNKFQDNDFIFNNKNGYYLWKKEINMPKTYFHQSIEKE